MTQSEEQRQRLKKKKNQSLRDLQTIIKDQTFVSLESSMEGEKKEDGAANLCKEIMTENCPNVARDISLQEAERTLNRETQINILHDTP